MNNPGEAGECLKVVHVIFEARHEAEVIGLLHREVAVPRYMRLDDVAIAYEVERQGRRAYRMDGRNSLIVIVCTDEVAGRIVRGVAAVGKRVGDGVSAYAMPAEQAV